MRRLLPIAAALAVLAACAGCGTETAGTTTVEALSISHNLLMDGSSRFVARGVADYVLPFYEGDDGPDPSLAQTTAVDYAHRLSMFETMHRDGINLVRIPLGYAAYQGGGYGISSKAGYIHRVVETVQAAQQAGLRVLLSWWDSLGWGAQLPGQYRSLWPMMAAVVKAVGNDPDVFYEPYNEPNGINWQSWTAIMEATVREWRTVFHYRGVLVLDTTNYSWDFSPSAVSAVRDLDATLLHGHSGLAFANHRYPDGATCFCGNEEQSWQSAVGAWSSTYPIIGTEYGIYSAGYPANLNWMRQLLPVLTRTESSGFNGAVLFVWNWVDANSTTSNNGQALNAYGQAARSLLWDHR